MRFFLLYSFFFLTLCQVWAAGDSRAVADSVVQSVLGFIPRQIEQAVHQHSGAFPELEQNCPERAESLWKDYLQKQEQGADAALLHGLRGDLSFRMEAVPQNPAGDEYDDLWFVGVSMDLLRNGWLDETENRKRQAWKDSLRLNLLRKDGLPKDLCGLDSLLQLMQFNLADELFLHQQTLQKLSESYRLLYFAGLVNSDEVRGIQDESLRTKARWQGMRRSLAMDATDSNHIENPVSRELPALFDIDINGLREAVAKSSWWEEQLRLELLNGDLSRNWKEQIGFRLWTGVRADRDQGEYNNGLAAGASLRIPFGGWNQSPMLDLANSRWHQGYLDLQKQEIDKRLLRHYEDFRIQLEEAESARRQLKADYAEWQMLMARLKEYGKGSNWTKLRRIITSVLHASWRLEYRRFRLYAEFYKVASVVPMVEFKPHLRVIADEERVQNAIRKGDRSIYIWSRTLRYDAEFLVSFFQVKEISRVWVSPGPGQPAKALPEFIKQCQIAGVVPVWLIGDAGWLDHDFSKSPLPKRVLDHLQNAKDAGVQRVHLDLEPQSRDDWKTQREFLLQRWMTFSKNLRTAWPEGLEAAIPMYFPDSVIQLASDVFDEVTVMAYEEPDAERLQSRIAEEKEILKDKLRVAVRPEDFSDEVAMELLFEELFENGLNKFGVHDANSYMEMMQ